MMRTILIAPLLTLILFFSICAGQEQIASISPQKPKIGDEILITYNAEAKSANLQLADEITAELLLMREGAQPYLLEVPMKKVGSRWQGSTKISDEKAKLILLRFTADDLIDDNGESVWHCLVYGNDGNPVQGAHVKYAESIFFTSGYIGFRLPKDIKKAKDEIAKEKELYPNNIAAFTMLWTIWVREAQGSEASHKIKEELSRLYEINKQNEEAVVGLLSWFDETGQKEKKDEIVKVAIAANPKGKIAQRIRDGEVFSEKDLVKRAEMLEVFLKDFSLKEETRVRYQTGLIGYLIQAKQYDKAVAVLGSSPQVEYHVYGRLAMAMLNDGANAERILNIAKKGVEFVKDPNSMSKFPYLNTREWENTKKIILGGALTTYGYVLYKAGKREEARQTYEEAFEVTKGENSYLNNRLLEFYIENGNYRRALAVAEQCLEKNKSDEKLLENYKTAYIKVNGSENGFDKKVDELKNRGTADLKKEILKTQLNKPATDFTLKSLDGKTITLSSLKGKVVVIDFWATWCGPCVASFPFLQQVYNKYKDNPNVVILALNTGEHEKGEARESLIKKFIADNKYTFPVVFDEEYADKYGVQMIPTKFVVDKKGQIQFKGIGFEGGEKLIMSLSLQIELLLDDGFYSLH